MKRILITLPRLSGGGAERVMINLGNKFSKMGYNVYFLLLSNEGEFSKNVSEKINVVVLNKRSFKSAIFPMIKSMNIIKPEVIISTLWQMNLIVLMSQFFLKERKKTKIIIREANNLNIELDTLSFLKKRIYKSIYKFLYKYSDKIVVQCDEMKERTQMLLDSKTQMKVIRIYNPILSKEIAELGNKENPFEYKDKINIIAIGRLEFQKGFDLLIQSFSLIKNQKIHLTILGDGTQKEQLLYQIKKFDLDEYIDLKGFEPNPYKYIKNADIFVLPSRFEGFPNVLLESLCLNTFIISYECPSGPKEIIQNEDIGTLVPPQDIIALSNAINQAINEKKYKSHNDSNLVSQHYDISYIARIWEEEFNF